MDDFYFINSRKYRRGEIIPFPYLCGENKTICHPYTCVLNPGRYKFEVYGAEGGKGGTDRGGYGGYSIGTFITVNRINTYLYVGAQGPSTNSTPNSTSPIAFNGGGSSINSDSTTTNDDDTYYASSGGGASDIRILKDDLYHRIIVAGGGGGSGKYNVSQYGGNGGGTKGKGGEQNQHPNYEVFSKGGNETGDSSYFGYGGNATEKDGCGGGGGWFGGTAGWAFTNPGGGGSGFVFTKENQEIATLANLELESEYYLTNAFTYEMGEKGRSGDGLIKITILNFFDSCGTIKIYFNFRYFCSIFLYQAIIK